MADDLDALAVFVGVADARGFRSAGRRLGVIGSAVSQALRRLEDRLGVTLVQRTTRSMHLTPAGEQLLRPALDDLHAAVASVGETSAEPRGTLRLHVSTAAESYLSGPLVASFLAEHPHVRLDLALSDAPVDVVAEGYDAGVRLGEVIDLDMVAVAVSGDLRLIVVGAPSYFARHPVPLHPRVLVEHDYINWHPTAAGTPYRWEFTEDGREFSVAVPARVLTTDLATNLRAGPGRGRVDAGIRRPRGGRHRKRRARRRA